MLSFWRVSVTYVWKEGRKERQMEEVYICSLFLNPGERMIHFDSQR